MLWYEWAACEETGIKLSHPRIHRLACNPQEPHHHGNCSKSVKVTQNCFIYLEKQIQFLWTVTAGIEILAVFGEMEHKLLLLGQRMLGFREFSG